MAESGIRDGLRRTTRISRNAQPQREAPLVEEALTHLVYHDQVLEARSADIQPGRAAEGKGGVARVHGGIGVARPEARRDVERCIGEILLHAREIRTDLEA